MISLAVIGYPVKHSLSPVMQRAGLAALGIQGTYEAIEVLPENLGTFAEYALGSLNGFNVTLPHKGSIIPYLNIVDPVARRAQSVNTVSVKEGILIGLSTDGYGLESGLREAFSLRSLEGASIAFLGCGGAVQSVAHYLAAMSGLKRMVFLNRTVSKAAALKTHLSAYPYPVQVEVAGLNSPHLSELLSGCDILVQGTSLGLTPDDPLPLDPALLPSGIAVYDMIYWETSFLKACRNRSLKVADGRGMLLHQGAAALSHWTGCVSPLEVMREALNAAIAERQLR